METSTIAQLLKLPPDDRVELAMALWASLSDAEREGALALSDEDAAEHDRRWAEHLADPGSGVPWPEVRRKLVRNG
jgi:putative addiction module component (TIGR02574 family)